MLYKITIERIETSIKDWPEWRCVADSGNERDGGKVYDYVPSQRHHSQETTVYEQHFEDIDIKEIVAFLNSKECLNN